jgi:hypothetical protein
MTSSFAGITQLYRDIAASVTNPKDYFSSDEYRKYEKVTEIAYGRLEPLCNSLIGVLQGKKKGDEIGFPGIENKISFSVHVLKQQSTDMLPAGTGKTIDDIINDTFLLGLISHLFLCDCPSRNNFESVDIQAVMNNLIPKIMSSSSKMRKYNKEFNTVPVLIFENYYDNNIIPILKEQLKLGTLSRAAARNYFINLFFSGARYGEQLDKEAKLQLAAKP